MGLDLKRTAKFKKQLGRQPAELRKLLMASRLGLPDRYIPHSPSPKQHVALMLPHQEVFFGGAAGGGKSDWMLMGALMWVHVPGFHAIIFRRTFADLDLEGALIPRSHAWLDGTDAVWNGQKHKWTFPSGATISFGYMKTEQDKFRYKGTEFPWIGFDELTQFTHSQYTYLFSRNRANLSVKVPWLVRSASNPGQAGHEWVKGRFLIETKDPLVRKKRIFVPSTLADNPGIDQEKYLEKLSELTDEELAKLRDGDWDAAPSGNVFQDWWFDIRTTPIPELCRIHRHWDLAGSAPSPDYPDPDWTVGLLMVEFNGYFVILDVDRFRAGPAEVEKRIRATALADQAYFERPVGQSIEQEPGQSGKAQVARFNSVIFRGMPTKNIKPIRNKLVRAGPVASASRNRFVSLFPLPIRVYTGDDIRDCPWGQDPPGAWMQKFKNEVGGFDGLQKKKDDIVDAFTGCHKALTDGADSPAPVAFADNVGSDSVWAGIMQSNIQRAKEEEARIKTKLRITPSVVW